MTTNAKRLEAHKGVFHHSIDNMNSKFSSLLIIIMFLSMQIFSLMHVSEYALEKHEHNGESCNVYLNAEHNTLLEDTPFELVTPNLLTFKIILPRRSLPFSRKSQIFEARAPPVFS